jgi:hypothetical protein
LEIILAGSGIKVPSDLVRGSYRWRSYLYALLFKDKAVTLDGRATVVDLHKSLMAFHKLPWSRDRIIPLDVSKADEIRGWLLGTIWSTDSGDTLRAALWQRQSLIDGNFYTDDHVMSLLPYLKDFVRKATQ